MRTYAEVAAEISTMQAEHSSKINKLYSELDSIVSAPENNVYESVDDARDTLEERFREEAGEACGSYEYGADKYWQQFSVDGKQYIFTMEVEYGRYDKQWYFVEDTRVEIEEIE